MTLVSSTRFAGRRILVTGAARGIGRAIADRFAAEGGTAIVADRDREAAEAAVADIRSTGGAAESLEIDISDAARMLELADQLGQVDVVVANAGIQTFAPVLDLTPEEWERVMTVNAGGSLTTLQLAARVLPDGGSVVTMASIQGLLANPLSAHYAASKAAVLSLTKTFARELAPRGIRVNAVAPGRIDTPLSDYANIQLGRITGSDPAEMTRKRVATIPLGRTGRPEEIAAVVAFLASEDASYITGECINVCGGDVML